MLVRADHLNVAREPCDGSFSGREGGLHVLLVLQLYVRDVDLGALNLRREVKELAAQLQELSLHLRRHAGGLAFDFLLDPVDLELHWPGLILEHDDTLLEERVALSCSPKSVQLLLLRMELFEDEFLMLLKPQCVAL